MGCSFSLAKDGDVFTQRTANKSVADFTSHSTDKVVVIMDKNSNSISGSRDKIKVMKPSKILLIGDNRIKVATACYLKSLISMTGQNIEIVVGTRDPEHARNATLVNAGVRLLKADMSVPATLLPAIRQSGADVVLICSPSQKDKSTQTISGVSACKRAGVGHIVVLSQTCVERDAPSIFGDQCKQIESFVVSSHISYTIVRLPILMDNYLSQLQSMSEYGIFYRPICPNTRRNAVTISDVGTALGNILLSPASYHDRIVSLNGPLTDCGMAAEAFSEAFGKTIIYEQVSYESYRQTLLEASMPEWQVDGILELFKMFEKREPFCMKPTKELEEILGRPPTTIFELAKAALAVSRPRAKSSVGGNHGFYDLSYHGKSSNQDLAASSSEMDLQQSPEGKESDELPERVKPRRPSLAKGGSDSPSSVPLPTSTPNSTPSPVTTPKKFSSIGIMKKISGSKDGLLSMGSSRHGDKGDKVVVINTNANVNVNGSGSLTSTCADSMSCASIVEETADCITLLRPYSRLNIFKSLEATPASNISPAGIAGILKITLSISSTAPLPQLPANDPHLSSRIREDHEREHPDLLNCLDRRYCVLLDGVFTYLPESVITNAMGEDRTRAIGSMENKSTSLAGYVIQKLSPTRISVKGSRGETVALILDALSPEDCQRWFNVLSAHVEFVDSRAGSRWLF